MKFLSTVFRFFPQFSGIVFLHYGFIVLFRIWGMLSMGGSGHATDILNGIVADVIVISVILFFLYIPYGLIAIKNIRLANIITGSLSVLFYALSAPVQAYFISGTQLLNISQYNCSVCGAYLAAINQVGLVGWLLPGLVLLLAGTGYLWWLIRNKVEFPSYVGKMVLAVLIISIPLAAELKMNTGFLNKNGYRISKPYHFAQSGVTCITDKITGEADRLTGAALVQSLRPENTYISPDEYPLLRTFQPKECLSRYFNMAALAEKPHIVMIIVEGLGDPLMNPVKGVTIMPFLQELAQKGLYWDHFLATSEGEQNTLPSILGGLPYGDNGFAQRPIVPYHFSLLNILKHNNYNTSYFTGQRNRFSFTDKFLNYNNTDVIVDAREFPENYNKIITGDNNYFWGHNDGALLDYYFNSRVQKIQQPRFDIIQTGSMKSPYYFDNKTFYDDLFEQRVAGVNNAEDKAFLESKKEGLTAAVYTDEMLRQLFDKYAGSADYNNTIFVVTGNYPMPAISAGGALKRFHVPLIIYSPGLKSAERIHSLSSHNDISHTLLSFLNTRYSVEIPQITTSTGNDLCMGRPGEKTFIPLPDQNGNIREMVFGSYFIDAAQQIHEIGEDFSLQTPSQKKKDLRPGALQEAYIQVNARGAENLMPDSLYFGFFNYNLLADTTLSWRSVREEYRNILENLPVEQGTHILDIRLQKPEVLLEEVFIVIEMYNESGNLLEWQNYGIPEGNEDFSVRHEIVNQYSPHDNPYLRVYIWNQSPVTYSFEKARTTVYRLPDPDSASQITD